MRKLIALCSAVMGLSFGGSAAAQWDLYHNDAPRWRMEGSLLAMDRSGDDNGLPLITDSLTLETLFNSGQATDLNTDLGVDISILSHPYGPVEWELEGLFARWETARYFNGPNLETPFLPGLSPDSIDYVYDSDLFSLELNARREWGPGFTFLIGPRFVYLDERVQTDTSTTIVQPIPLPDFTFQTQTIVDTKNPLVGGQVGAEIDWLLTQSLRMHGYVKAGGYANFSSAFVSQAATGLDTTNSDRQKSAGSFLGELGGRLYYQISPRACSFFLGYQAIWIDNVALAPVQFVTVNNINEDVILGVTPFIQAAEFGFEFTY